jgi:hypothetical protein
VLRERLRRFLNRSSKRRTLLRESLKPLRESGQPAVVFGGFIRDLLLQLPPRDVDLVVADEHLAAIEERLKPFIRRHNRFGGLNVCANGWEFDIWAVGQTWAFQQGGNWNKTFEELPKTTFLNIEAAAMELWPGGKMRQVFEHNFLDAFVKRTIEINYEANPYPDFCITRSLIAAVKLKFNIGEKLTQYIAYHSRSTSVHEIALIQQKHYKAQLLTESQIQRWLDRIRWFAEWQQLTPFEQSRPRRIHQETDKNQLSLF